MSYGMTYEEQQAAWQALRDARKYVEKANEDANAEHDNYGELYQDEAVWWRMKSSKELLARIDALLKLEA